MQVIHEQFNIIADRISELQTPSGQFNIIADWISALQTPSIIAERKCRNNIMEVIISK